jgi:hypothetical protein
VSNKEPVISAEAKQCAIQTKQYINWGRTEQGAIGAALGDVFPKKKLQEYTRILNVLEERGNYEAADFQAALDKLLRE